MPMKGRYHLPEKSNPIKVRMVKEAKIIGLEYPPGQLSLVVDYHPKWSNTNHSNTEDRLFHVCGEGSLEIPTDKEGNEYDKKFVDLIRLEPINIPNKPMNAIKK